MISKPYILSLLFLMISCGKTALEKSANSYLAAYASSSPSLYFQKTQKIVVEVYYEPGAEPFTGTTPRGIPYWKILEDNLNAIFKYRSSLPVIIVPKDLSAMRSIPAQNKTKWTAEDIIALNSMFKQISPTETEAHFYLYFLKGNSVDSNSIIAESINGTPVIAVFKNVITSSGSPTVQRYVEQSTLVHEMGHALGFVNNGVPMTSTYQDTTHGKHSTNQNCVMYWQNEGSKDLQTFVAHFITTGDTVMWGPEIQSDAQAYSK